MKNGAPASGAVKEVVNTELGQIDAWNRHDLQAYLAYYWNSPDLISMGGKSQILGYSALATKLIGDYGNDRDSMGTFHLNGMKVKTSGSDAFIVSNYVANTNSQVYYIENTEVMRHFPYGWRIVFEKGEIRAQ
jgi:ketosteroid isomerase-like protein